MRTNQKVNKQRTLLRKVFATFPKDLSINDLADHVDTLAALIVQAQKEHTNELKVEDLKINLKVKAAPHPELIQAVYDAVKSEKAPDEVSALLAKFMDHIKFQVKGVAFFDKKVSDLSLEEMLK